MTDTAKPISAFPTKSFFVDMLVRDIPLEQAVLDLVDNCIDGAKRLKGEDSSDLSGLRVEILFSDQLFAIKDNCGGFDTETAQLYAFRFGRPKGSNSTKHSIGQFGVGMKRALFKFGHKFLVQSKTADEEWAVEVDVPVWEADEDNWVFPWSTYQDGHEIGNSPGTYIEVSNLRKGTATSFGTKVFENRIISSIKSKHRQFISLGLEIFVNGNRVDAADLKFFSTANLKPVVENFVFDEDGLEPVTVRVIVGISDSIPKNAGWYVVCNGRVILDSDRREETGWGVVEENADRPSLPSFHNQYSRFRGIVYFDSDDSSRVPWNTMKTDIDEDSLVWQRAYERMVVLARHVLDFINKLDSEIEDYGREKSPLMRLIRNAPKASVDSLRTDQAFKAPDKSSVDEAPPTIKIQYSRPIEEIELLKEALKVDSARGVGERTFEIVLERNKG